jgi:hypothetical protein
LAMPCQESSAGASGVRRSSLAAPVVLAFIVAIVGGVAVVVWAIGTMTSDGGDVGSGLLVLVGGLLYVAMAHITAWIRRDARGGTPREGRTTHIPAGPGSSAQVRVSGTFEDFDRDLAEGLGFSEPPRERRPGRPRTTTDQDLAELAELYVRALDGGSTNPIRDVARWEFASQSRTRDRIHEARRRGILTRPPVKGRPGGELTEKAQQLLAQDPR